MEKELSTEEKILQSAEFIFLRDGYDGARMQEIADHANINKAMLHYYFRNKDLLFARIFTQKMQAFFPIIQSQILKSTTVVEKLQAFVAAYMDLLLKTPYLPHFILSSVHKNPDLLKEINNPMPAFMLQMLEKELSEGNYRKVSAHQLFISILGMCVMPFVGKPMLKHIFCIEEADFQKILQERTKEIQSYIAYILQPAHA